MRLFAAVLCVAWVSGIGFGVAHAPWFAVAMAAALFSGWIKRLKLAAPIHAACLLLVCFGAVLGSAANANPISEDSCGGEQNFEARVTTVYKRADDRTQYVVQSKSQCTYLVTAGRWPYLNEGNFIEIIGRAQPLNEIPAQYEGYANFLYRKGISGTIRYPEITVLDSHTLPVSKLRETLRLRVSRSFAEPEASVIGAMLLGDDSSIPQKIQDDFRRTGTTHILAISGQNLSLLAAVMLLFLLAVPLPKVVRSLTLLLFLWLYVWLLGFPVSATRAVIFWTLAMSAWHINSLVSLPTIILVAAAAMGTIEPVIFLDIGWQLSFAAVVGIGLSLFVFSGRRLAAWQTALLGSVGAGLATYPVTVWHFNSFSLISLPANLLIVPAVPVLMVFSLVALGVGMFVPVLAYAISFAVHLIWAWIYGVAGVLSHVPAAFIEDVSISPWILAAYYLIIFAVAHMFLKNRKRSWREIWQ